MSQFRIWIILIIVVNPTTVIANDWYLSQYNTTNWERTTRIVGGKIATNKYPWMVSIGFNKKIFIIGLPFDEETHVCGGTLIDEQWVLTAAHCVKNGFLTGADGKVLDINAEDINVIVGQPNLKVPAPQIGVSKYYLYDKYDESELRHDIALLKLKEKLSLSTIKILEPSIGLKGAEAMALGWGITTNISRLTSLFTILEANISEPFAVTLKGKIVDWFIPKELHEVMLPIVSKEICKLSYHYGSSTFQEQVKNDEKLCAGWIEGYKNICTLDSGGPLVVWNNQRKQWLQVGIVSGFTKDSVCSSPGNLGIYTQISKYREFIEKTLELPKDNSLFVKQEESIPPLPEQPPVLVVRVDDTDKNKVAAFWSSCQSSCEYDLLYEGINDDDTNCRDPLEPTGVINVKVNYYEGNLSEEPSLSSFKKICVAVRVLGQNRHSNIETIPIPK